MSEEPDGTEPDRTKRRLDRADIVDAAVALIDTEGIAQLTMRRLGAALGVEAMALYRYFPSRRSLLDGLVESVVNAAATDPQMQLVADDDWSDYLDRLAHGIRRMALTHPRLFPLIATHPTEAPWLRPPLRSVRWVDSFLAGLQDHHFPPAAAVSAYKQFSTFLLGHLLLEVAALGLDHPDTASAPPPPPDADMAGAQHDRVRAADRAEAAMGGEQSPSAADILDAGVTRDRTVAGEPAVVASDPAVAAAAAGPGHAAAVTADADVPVIAAMASTSTVSLTGFEHVSGLAGLLARDTSAADFDRDLGRLLEDLRALRRA